MTKDQRMTIHHAIEVLHVRTVAEKRRSARNAYKRQWYRDNKEQINAERKRKREEAEKGK